MRPRHVLDGYRVLDFTQYLAGPSASRLLVEMGAEVIKVEIAPGGDPTRLLPYSRDGRSCYYVQQNRGKKSLCLRVDDPRGRRLLERLVETADVLLENFSPGAIARLGFGWERVQALNPRLVMCSISGFGQEGPLSELQGIDIVAQAYAGVSDLIGQENGPPALPLLSLGDVNTGVHAVAAINAALLDRTRTGRGQWLDISLLDCYYHCHEINVHAVSASGGALVPRRSGAHHFAVCPLGAFKGSERYFMLMGSLHFWAPLCRVMGREDLIDHPDFATNDARCARRDEVVALIEGWLQAQGDDAAVLARLQEARIPCAPVLTVAETIAHPHFRQRRTVRRVRDPFIGEFDIPGMPLRFSGYPEITDLEAPLLGEHNAEVLAGLGVGEGEIAELTAAGVLVRGER
jgi:crotonobetainyl-CoA:carnitine CoA-transferase CaiB-like acyl-CoA transferase